MVSVINRNGMWYAIYHIGDHVRSDQTNVISSAYFHSTERAEAYAVKLREWEASNVES